MRFLLVAALGVPATCVLAAVLLDPARPKPVPLAFPVLATRLASADRIELVHAGHVLWLERRGQVWGLARQGGYPARQDMANTLMDSLVSLRLLAPTPGPLDAEGLGDPFGPDSHGGTFVRVLGQSGATLSAIIVGPAGSMVVRRPGEDRAWSTNAPIVAPAEAESWSQHVLPPLDGSRIAAVTDDGGLGSATVQAALAALPISDVTPLPQHRPAPIRVVRLALDTGTAVLTVGMEGAQPWLTVSGTSAWAGRLAPYAFALPGDSPLAAP